MTLDLTLSREQGSEEVTVRVEPDDSIEDTLDDLRSYWKLSGSLGMEGDQGQIDTTLQWQDSDVEDGDTLTLFNENSKKTLPIDTWHARIERELSRLEEDGYRFESEEKDDSFIIDLHLDDIGAPIQVGEKIGLAFKHRLDLTIQRTYPYEAPYVVWQTAIFHPNIAPPEKDGELRSTLVENWTFDKNLSDLLQHIEDLLTEPELDYTIDISDCRDAAEEYRENDFPVPRDDPEELGN